MANTEDVPLGISYFITIIINSVACPFTVLLNVLVIKVVMTRPRLRTNSNILLACLAVTDVLTGLFGQPSHVLWRIFLISGLSTSEKVEDFHFNVMFILATVLCLHLILVSFERLVAIKFTMQYPNVITDSNLKIAVSAIWIIAFMCGTFRVLKMYLVINSMASLITISCIVFVVSAQVILFRETRRHQRKIKARQLPQDEVERFTREYKALKTTVFVIGAIIVCLLPACFCSTLSATGLYGICPINDSLWQTCILLNSLVNPLIYCWRQKEMRKFLFRIRTQVVHPAIQ